MRWGARFVLVAMVMSLAMSMIVGTSSVASATATASLEEVQLPVDDVCTHQEVRYTAHDEANNVTVTDNAQLASMSDEAYCPTPSPNIAVVDTGATISAAGAGCIAASSVGTCSAEQVDRIVVTTGAGDDTIRVATTSGLTTTEVWAGAGNDTVRSLNGIHDAINCGDGHDVVIADATDAIAPDCEVVQFAA